MALKKRKTRRHRRKRKKRRADASGGGSNNNTNTNSSVNSLARKKRRNTDTDGGKVSKSKIKSTLTVGKTERNKLRNVGRDISYAVNVNTSRKSRKDDAGVSIRSTLYKQGGEKKLRIKKLDIDSPERLRDTINAIVDMDGAGDKNAPLKKIEIDLVGVKDLDKMKDALKELDPSIEVEFKFKDRGRTFNLEEGFGGVQTLIKASKDKPKKNENIAAIESILSEAQKIQTKDDPTLKDIEKLAFLNNQMDGFIQRAESEMNGKAEEDFLKGIKLALALEAPRVASQKTKIEDDLLSGEKTPKENPTPPKDAAAETKAKTERDNIEKTLTVKQTEQNKLRNVGREIDYAFNINSSKNDNDSGVGLTSTLFKKDGNKVLQIKKLSLDDSAKLKNTIDAINNMNQLGDSKNDPLKKIEIDLTGVTDLGKLNEALQDLDASIEIELKFKDKDRNRPYVLQEGFDGMQFFMEASKGRPKNNETINTIESLINTARILQSNESSTPDDIDKLIYLNNQISGFLRRARKETQNKDELSFIDGVKLALDMESNRLVDDKEILIKNQVTESNDEKTEVKKRARSATV